LTWCTRSIAAAGWITETRSRVSFASTVLPNPVGFLRLCHAQKPNRYRARGTPNVSLPAIAARPLVNTASGIVQFRVQSEVSSYSDQVRFNEISRHEEMVISGTIAWRR